MASNRVAEAFELILPAADTAAVRRHWVVGWIMSAAAVTFLLVDSAMKPLSVPASVESTVELGYPASLVPWIGLLLLVCLVIYIVPRTAVLGAILLTGYLGGAAATQVRLEDPWFVLPVVLGLLLWAGLSLRDEWLQQVVPLRRRGA